jgi:hypothetical protein
MSLDIHTTQEQLDRAYRSIAGARDRQEAAQTLRKAIDQAQRVLKTPPERHTDGQVRHAFMQLQCTLVLAEGTLRGYDPAA